MFNRIVIILNPIAGGNKNKASLLSKLTGLLSTDGREVSVQTTLKRGDAIQFARAAVQSSADLIVVAGGDGTVNEVGSALVNTGVPLAIIPRGSGNGLARTIGIPSELDQAAALINQGIVCDIDAGKANERYFFMLVGSGFDALVGHKFDTHHARGPLPYFYLGAKEFLGYRSSALRLSFGEVELSLSPFLVTVANARQFGNNALIAPHAILNDGLLDICIVHRLTFFDLLFVMPKLFKGRIRDYSGVEFHTANFIRLERERPDFINLDGEAVLEDAVVNISVLPRSLKVVTPKTCPAILS
jgi:YegS/Rv2252/BmrU family lipid kinase